jgi:hypothetical protein
MIRPALFTAMSLLCLVTAAAAGAREGASSQTSLDVARRLLSEVEHSPSANLDELRATLLQARAAINAALKANADHPETVELSKRIDALLLLLAPKPRAEHPQLAEADALADRLTAAVKGGGSCDEINDLSTHLLILAEQVEPTYPEAASRFRQRVDELKTLAPVPSCIASVGP